MSLSEMTRFRIEQIDPSVFVASGAVIVGDVTMLSESSVWFHSVIRGDTAPIRVGRQTNIQDLCVVHADEGFPCVIGDRVTVGHGAIVHGAHVEDEVLIGMKAVIMNGARIGSGSLVAVGALVTEGMVIPPNSVVMGAPATVRRDVVPRDRERMRHAWDHYVTLAKHFRAAGTPRPAA